MEVKRKLTRWGKSLDVLYFTAYSKELQFHLELHGVV